MGRPVVPGWSGGCRAPFTRGKGAYVGKGVSTVACPKDTAVVSGGAASPTLAERRRRDSAVASYCSVQGPWRAPGPGAGTGDEPPVPAGTVAG